MKNTNNTKTKKNLKQRCHNWI